MASAVGALQRNILDDYAATVGLTKEARYLGGGRLRPVVPLDTAAGGIFIIGAYPSARFALVDGENDVPVGDNLGPFEPERYFDGARVRTQKSADELEQFYLRPLGITRSSCWITDIVKVFLFKLGHREKYRRLGTEAPAGYERERFEELALKSMGWIGRELEVARPRLVITLGAEIAGLLRGVKTQARRNALLGPSISQLQIGSTTVPTVHLAHPGIVMRKTTGGRNRWPEVHETEHIPALKRALTEL